MTMNNNRRLVVLYGATGVGKTELSIALSRRYNAPIVSSDSRQVFREMRIGSAVPSEDELAAAPHYFIHDRSIHDNFSAGAYEKEALCLLDKLFEQTQCVLLVGGSNLYINALLNGFDDLPFDETVREQVSTMTIEQLREKLANLDPAYYQTVDLNNMARLRRAVEVCLVSGVPYSELRTGSSKARNFDVLKVGLHRERAELYDRINRRVDIMMEQGLLEEARALYPHRTLPSLQTVGYRELFDHFDGTTTLEQAVELIKQNSRRYAKRQTTWLRREENIEWFSPDDIESIIMYIDSRSATVK